MPYVARKKIVDLFGIAIYKGVSSDYGKIFIKFGKKRSKRFSLLEKLWRKMQ